MIYINYSRKHAPTYWPDTIKRYSTILQQTHVSMGLNSRDLEDFEHATSIASKRDAVVSSNTFDVP